MAEIFSQTSLPCFVIWPVFSECKILHLGVIHLSAISTLSGVCVKIADGYECVKMGWVCENWYVFIPTNTIIYHI